MDHSLPLRSLAVELKKDMVPRWYKRDGNNNVCRSVIRYSVLETI